MYKNRPMFYTLYAAIIDLRHSLRLSFQFLRATLDIENNDMARFFCVKFSFGLEVPVMRFKVDLTCRSLYHFINLIIFRIICRLFAVAGAWIFSCYKVSDETYDVTEYIHVYLRLIRQFAHLLIPTRLTTVLFGFV